MNFQLKNHQIWQEIAEILAEIDVNALVREHLEDCHYTISGYWDENEFYQEITFLNPISAELVSSFFGITVGETDNSHWLKFKFLLLADTSADSGKLVSDVEKRIGELVLIFDSNLEFVDENWLIDVKSPFVVAKRSQDLTNQVVAAKHSQDLSQNLLQIYKISESSNINPDSIQ